MNFRPLVHLTLLEFIRAEVGGCFASQEVCLMSFEGFCFSKLYSACYLP